MDGHHPGTQTGTGTVQNSSRVIAAVMEQMSATGVITQARKLERQGMGRDAQLQTQKDSGKGIEGDWLVVVDKSQSQDWTGLDRTWTGRWASGGLSPVPVTKFDLTHGRVDYYSIPNLVQQMNSNRYGLEEKVMGVGLLTLEEALGMTGGMR